ncbi:hypothetical protein DRE_00188 [Drechslerella stenobrocha 248]|uniref:Aminoglycoside phosphotransferase domain-containing protein n=1 Tax=Drechslerella stenobrocha 248 TaxID=1043628 RepID=W7I978_9PEZI|nr:hypothetical protein DRE_00188 [Drechslerella stenobrocha 248]
MILTFDRTLPFTALSPLQSEFQPHPLHPAHKLYLDFRIYLARTVFRFILRLFSALGAGGELGRGNPGFRIARISRQYCIKWGVRDVEARAMCFVRENTGVPVPQVWGFWSHREPGSGVAGKGKGSKTGSRLNYMLIEALPGEPVGDIWADMDETARERFKREFVGYLRELRGLDQPPLPTREVDANSRRSDLAESSAPSAQALLAEEGDMLEVAPSLSVTGHRYIGALNHQPLTDHRIATIPYGPFEDVQGWLNCEYLLGYVSRARPRDVYESLEQQLTRRKDWKVVFTHSDLTPRNVLVEKHSGRITGIVDWDSAGWCVEWWEGVKGLYGWTDRSFLKSTEEAETGSTGLLEVWRGLLREVVGDFDGELKADEGMRDIYGFPY